MKRKFKEIKVKIPQFDCDVTLIFPSGKEVVIQARPSNADVNYNGSLDIILPDNQVVTNWWGDDMQPAVPSEGCSACDLLAKQLVTELP